MAANSASVVNPYFSQGTIEQFQRGDLACLEAYQSVLQEAIKNQNPLAAREILALCDIYTRNIPEENLISTLKKVSEEAKDSLPEGGLKYNAQCPSGLEDRYTELREYNPLFLTAFLKKMPTFYLGARKEKDIYPSEVKNRLTGTEAPSMLDNGVDLPPELAAKIFEHIGYHDLQAVACTNTYNNILAWDYIPKAKLERLINRALPTDQAKKLLEMNKVLPTQEQIQILEESLKAHGFITLFDAL